MCLLRSCCGSLPPVSHSCACPPPHPTKPGIHSVNRQRPHSPISQDTTHQAFKDKPRGQGRFKTARFHRPFYQQIDYQPIPFLPRANDSFSFPFPCPIASPLPGHCLAPFAHFAHSTTAPFPAFRCRCGMLPEEAAQPLAVRQYISTT